MTLTTIALVTKTETTPIFKINKQMLTAEMPINATVYHLMTQMEMGKTQRMINSIGTMKDMEAMVIGTIMRTLIHRNQLLCRQSLHIPTIALRASSQWQL